MVDNAEVEILNKRIGGEYMTIDGHQIFRLVWSESIFENRYGTFREFTESGLFVRETTETRRVRKYNYIHNRWIFEMWAPGNLVANRETPDAINGDYVPIYVFEDRGGLYLPPNEKVIRFLIAALQGKVKKDDLPSQAYLEEREIAQTIESMDDHPNWFQTRPGIARNSIWYKGGIPEWERRRATFSVRNEESIRAVEERTLLEIKEKGLNAEKARLADERDRLEREKGKVERAREREKRKEIGIDSESGSPMHRRQQ